MTYGRPTPDQLEAIAEHVSYRQVYDLGCGNCILAAELIDRGAGQVIAIDKGPIVIPSSLVQLRVVRDSEGRIATGSAVSIDSRIIVVQKEFRDYKPAAPIDVAFLSWPPQYEEAGGRDGGLTDLVAQAKTVVYLGSNTDSNACGSVFLFKHLLCREVLVQIPARQNTLTIYGDFCDDRFPTAEEFAVLHREERMFTFDEMQQYSGLTYSSMLRAKAGST